MSKKLLRKAWIALNIHCYIKVIPLMKEIEIELNKPEPEPVAWAIFRKGTMYDFSRTQPGEELLGQMGDYAIPVYTIPPDQSAQIAALKHELQQANEDYVSVEEAYLQCQKDLYGETEKLAALQAAHNIGV